MTNFSKLLSTKVEDARRPRPLPVGAYMGVIDRHEFGESSKKKAFYTRFHYWRLRKGTH